MFRRIRRRVEPITNETISIRAYQLWEARGRPECDGTEDWQNAKDQLGAESVPSRRRPLRRLLARLKNRAA
ncbi:MAG: DUF2934 domain-containing protein [Bythopirellula sp.]